MSQFNLNLAQALSALQRKGIPLPFEMGAFLVLETTEQALVLEATATGEGLPVIAAADIWLSDLGELSVEPSGRTGPETDACRALVGVLGELLVRSATGVPAMLLTLAEQGPSDGQWSLLRLRDDLEASLVPLNRAAMRRVLARLLRELQRDVERTSGAPPPNVRAIDRELDAMLGIESPAAAEQEAVDEAELEHGDGDDDDEVWEERPTGKHIKRHEPARGPAAAPPAPRLHLSPDSADASSKKTRPARGDLDEFERESSAEGRNPGLWIGVGLMVLAGVLLAGYLLLGREGSKSALGLSPPAAESPPPARR